MSTRKAFYWLLYLVVFGRPSRHAIATRLEPRRGGLPLHFRHLPGDLFGETNTGSFRKVGYKTANKNKSLPEQPKKWHSQKVGKSYFGSFGSLTTSRISTISLLVAAEMLC